MEGGKFTRNAKEEIRDCLQDYANNLTELKILLDGCGIERVRELFRNGHKVETVEEYLERYRREKRKTITTEEEKDSAFIGKAQKLNELANKINSLGQKIDEQTLRKIAEEAKNLVRS